MKKTFILFSLCAALVGCTETPQETTVHLKGKLIDMGTTKVPMSYDGAESMIGDGQDILLLTDEEGRFDTILTVKEPTYYNILRNTLYLTPGDDMTIKITQNNDEAEFTGKGAEVNNYMKYRLFPKGGSFLNGGSGVKEDFAKTKHLIDSLAALRRNELAALKEATPRFKQMEGARIDADIVNSCLTYPTYAFSFRRDIKSREDFAKATHEANQEIFPQIQPMLKELMNDELLDVAVVRNVLSYVVKPEGEEYQKLAEGMTPTPYMNELYTAAGYVNELRRKVTPEFYKEVVAFIATMNDPVCKEEISKKLEQASKLMKGRPAIDFEMTDTEGKTHKLSEWKGKVIYLDFWATWCGACINESPYFEKLAKEMEGKDVVFVPVSTDRSHKDWAEYLSASKKELAQYNSLDRLLTTDWAIHFIPRFIVIDKDFKIVDAYAPRPSQPEAKALLEEVLAQ